MALEQSEAMHKAIEGFIAALDEARFAVLQIVTPLAGSLISGILFTAGKLSAADIMAIARVEEHYKDGIYDADKYGRDPNLEKTDTAMLRDLGAAELYRDVILSASEDSHATCADGYPLS